MRRLLWKEFRERWAWGTAWTALVLAAILRSHIQGFIGDAGMAPPVTALLFMLSTIVGAGGYSSEQVGNRAEFIGARPITWRRILLAKVLFGLLSALAASVLAGIAYRIVMPGKYLPFASVGAFIPGVMSLAFTMALGYLAGLSCSIALPGVAGGVLTGAMSFLALIMIFEKTHGLTEGHPYWQQRLAFESFWLPAGVAAGLIAALVVIARFGLTLPTPVRAIRYMSIVCGIFVASSVVQFFVPGRWITSSFLTWRCVYSSVSPSGEYAVSEWYPMPPKLLEGVFSGLAGKGVRYLARLSDGKKVSIGWEPNPESPWTADGSYIGLAPGRFAALARNSGRRQPGRISLLRLDSGGRLMVKSVSTEGQTYSAEMSPDRRLAMINPGLGDHEEQDLIFVSLDFGTFRKLKTVIHGAKTPWWQSNSEVGYLDGKNVRHIVRLDG